MARVLIGTSGWTYRSWRGRFYPKYLTPPSYLSFYANSFTTTEINTSFYHLPLASSYEKWAGLVPDNFIFSIKANRFITHICHLVNVDLPWRSFVANTLSLQSHLGPILVQFPPGFRKNTSLLEKFFEECYGATPGVRLAMEFRHESWFVTELYRLLARYSVALCIADGVKHPRRDVVTTDFAYVRYHGQRPRTAPCYSDTDLEAEANMIARFAKENLDVYAYFNNDAEGHAVTNAMRLRARLGA